MGELARLQVDAQAQLLSSTSYWEEGKVTVHCRPNLVHFHAHQAFEGVSSAIYGGGFRSVTDIANFQVAKDYDCLDPKSDVKQRFCALGVGCQQLATAVGFLTAARVSDAGWSTRSVDAGDGTGSVALLTCASVGTANRMRVGTSQILDANRRLDNHYLPGTINTIVLIAGQVTPEALIGGIITATEAKSAALADLKIEVQDGIYATGTSTDAILIGATGHPVLTGNVIHPIEYAGLATPFGMALGNTVYESVFYAGVRYSKHG